ncbi:F0F1 ATP synthase subunit delta [Fusibacter sp. 3D3]|uniref:F0F1 ATP synthase subunit delta n=1 Tax=Fusibacter sp. 3D3 TaxID=1048380 RepID=UPI000853E350|nr:F0F1 ATP synthase subunit delta [Fusibacter sp. 3D3]GAU75709.1 ATP synthase delta chain [Fusibacter sp. 3D3]
MAELVSKTYSEALFEVAKEMKMIDSFQAEFEFVVSSFNDYPDFFEIFKTPKIDFEEKKKMIHEIFSDKISENLLNFIYVILDKKRGSDILEIKSAFDQRVDDYKGIAKVTVETVVPLTESQRSDITEKLAIKTGKQVVLNAIINKSLVGGMVIKMGDQVIDGSVKYKLEGMLEGLTQIIV